MSAADKLAQVLGHHGLAGMAGGFGDQPDAKTHACRCDRRWVTAAEYAAHVAAVVLAHLTAEGWAQGKPEYAVSGAIMHPVLSYDHGAATTLHTKHGMPVVRRYVTDWEPVEGEEANDE